MRELNYLTSSLIHLINTICLVFLLQLVALGCCTCSQTASSTQPQHPQHVELGFSLLSASHQPCKVPARLPAHHSSKALPGIGQVRGCSWHSGCSHVVLGGGRGELCACPLLRKQDLTCFSGFTGVACGSQWPAALPPFTSSHMSTQTLTGTLTFPDVQIWDNFPTIQTKGLYLGKHFEPPHPQAQSIGMDLAKHYLSKRNCGLKQGKY